MDDVGRLWTGIGVCAAVILLMAFLTLCENAAVEFNDAKLKKMAEEDKDPKAIRLAALLGRTGRVVATNLIARSIMIIAVSVVGAIYFYAPLSNKIHKLFDVYTQASYYRHMFICYNKLSACPCYMHFWRRHTKKTMHFRQGGREIYSK